jgi:hypothetical protein
MDTTVTKLGEESAYYIEQLSISAFDPRQDQIDAAVEGLGGGKGNILAFDADFVNARDIASHALGPVIRWLGSREAEDQLGAELVHEVAGLDFTAARDRVREVLDVLLDVLGDEYPAGF